MNGGLTGRRGQRLGPDVMIGQQLWTPVLWDDEEDPEFHKASGIEALEEARALGAVLPSNP